MDPRGAILDELGAALDDLLAALGGGLTAKSTSALEAARLRADGAYLRLREADEQLGEAAFPYPEDVRAKAESLLRTDALVQSLVADAQSSIDEERGKLTTLRAALRQRGNQGRPSGAGRSCDVRG